MKKSAFDIILCSEGRAGKLKRERPYIKTYFAHSPPRPVTVFRAWSRTGVSKAIHSATAFRLPGRLTTMVKPLIQAITRDNIALVVTAVGAHSGPAGLKDGI